MKRDMDLIRTILLEVEGLSSDQLPCQLTYEGHSSAEVTYHIVLLDEAGYLVGEDRSTLSGEEWEVRRLTWAGHEFLDEARNKYVWDEVMANMKERGFVSASMDVMKGLLNTAVKKRLEG